MYRDLVVAIDARLMGSRNTGDTSYWRGLVSGLAGTDHNASIVLISNAERPEFIPDDPRIRWEVVGGRGGRWWSLFSFPRAAKRLGANVVHGQYTLSPLIRRGGVTTIHDVSFFIGPEWFRPRDLMLLTKTVPATCRRAARIITVSETSKAEIEKFIPAARGKVRVTHNAVAPQRRRLTDEDALARRTRLGIPEKYLLTVGTRWPRKNMSLAIAAAEKAGWPRRPGPANDCFRMAANGFFRPISDIHGLEFVALKPPVRPKGHTPLPFDRARLVRRQPNPRGRVRLAPRRDDDDERDPPGEHGLQPDGARARRGRA